MITITQRITAFLVIIFLVFHFGTWLVYQSPEGTFTGATYYLSKFYVRSTFNQNWKLFAPSPPKIEKTIYVRFQDANEKWMPIENPAWKWKTNHRNNRFSVDSKLYQLTQNIGHYLLQDVIYVKKQLGDKSANSREGKAILKEGFGCFLAERYLNRIVAESDRQNIRKAQLLLWLETPWDQQSGFGEKNSELVVYDPFVIGDEKHQTIK